MTLSAQDVENLEDILFAEPWSETALDFFGLHGVVCASVVGPVALSVDDIFRLATGGTEADAKAPEKFADPVNRLAMGLAQLLDSGRQLELPEPEDGDPMNALENWCAGFVEAFLENEDAWLSQDESETAEMMVPMMALSGIFDDEDFDRVRQSEKLSLQMADAIPETLTDLYLAYHAPE